MIETEHDCPARSWGRVLNCDNVLPRDVAPALLHRTVSHTVKDPQGYKVRLTTGTGMYYDRIYVLIPDSKEE
ncbi:MAG TPA: hypothetical protein VE170_16740 [Candidatus Limnocylindria bacterium]|nr:hypothetical protein [Candidatus Limnocylindria bacterium]